MRFKPSLRAQRSNPASSLLCEKLDCFAALAMTTKMFEMKGSMMRNAAMIGAMTLALGAAPATAGDDALVIYKSLSPEVALEAAQAALKKCRDNGFQIAVAVVDRFGQPQVMLRDRFAGPPAPDAAVAKAYTAVSFRAVDVGALEVDQIGPARCRPGPTAPRLDARRRDDDRSRRHTDRRHRRIRRARRRPGRGMRQGRH